MVICSYASIERHAFATCSLPLRLDTLLKWLVLTPRVQTEWSWLLNETWVCPIDQLILPGPTTTREVNTLGQEEWTFYLYVVVEEELECPISVNSPNIQAN